jgi:hypothetical protein
MPDLADLFPGYESRWIETSGGRIFARFSIAAARRSCSFTAILRAT